MVIYKKRFILTASDSGANFMDTGMALVGALKKDETLEQWVERTQELRTNKERRELIEKLADKRSGAIKDLEARLNKLMGGE